MRVANAINIRRCLGGEQLRVLDRMAYSGCFDNQALDSIATAITGRFGSKGLMYYLASLYLQLGETAKAGDLVKIAGRASSEMKWFMMLMLYCRGSGLPCPRLNRNDEQCLEYLQETYSGVVGANSPRSGNIADSGLTHLFESKSEFAVIGNAPSDVMDANHQILLSEDCLSICFNNYFLNPRIEGEAVVHVVTPSWRSAEQAYGRHLIITGNAIFHRRSKVWRRFTGRLSYAGIHTVPRGIWSSLVEQLGASPSAGLLLLSCLENHLDIKDKDALVAGFSDVEPVQNHSYDREPVSAAHNWVAEVQMRRQILGRIGRLTRTLRVTA